MRLQDLVRWFLPKDEHFYGFLERQAVAAHDGAVALAVFTRLDDVLDLTNSTARGSVLFGLARPTVAMSTLIDKRLSCLLKAFATFQVTESVSASGGLEPPTRLSTGT